MPNNDTTLLDASQPGLRHSDELYGQAGLATYVAAKIFGGPLPVGTPDWLKAAVESQANFAQRLPGADIMTIGVPGGGPLAVKTKAERQREPASARWRKKRPCCVRRSRVAGDR